MHTLKWYIDKARENNGLKSDRALARELGVSNTSVMAWRRGAGRHAWPTDENIVRLAEMAGADPTVALVELARWRAEGTSAAAFWDTVLHRAFHITMVFLLAFVLTEGTAKASEHGVNKLTSHSAELYIMRLFGLRRWMRRTLQAIENRGFFPGFFSHPTRLPPLS